MRDMDPNQPDTIIGIKMSPTGEGVCALRLLDMMPEQVEHFYLPQTIGFDASHVRTYNWIDTKIICAM